MVDLARKFAITPAAVSCAVQRGEKMAKERSCQRSSCAVIGRTAGRRGEDHKMILFSNNATNSIYCMKCHLKPSRIQVNVINLLYVEGGSGALE